MVHTIRSAVKFNPANSVILYEQFSWLNYYYYLNKACLVEDKSEAKLPNNRKSFTTYQLFAIIYSCLITETIFNVRFHCRNYLQTPPQELVF